MNQSFTQMLENLKASNENEYTLTIPENWMQGRTTYGGLSAALCLHAVELSNQNLPPLRTAQINFIGPAGGDITISVKTLRSGKSVTFIAAEMTSDKGVATHAIFCFGAKRPSKLDVVFDSKPDCKDPEQSKDFFSEGAGPTFSQNFDCMLEKSGFPLSGSDKSDHFIWTRFKEKVTSNNVSLLALADMPPPAVLPMFKEFAPISSMTWMLNFIQEQPTTTDQWWLMQTRAEHAIDGYSSQDMHIWNSDRELVITGRQNVAIFY